MYNTYMYKYMCVTHAVDQSRLKTVISLASLSILPASQMRGAERGTIHCDKMFFHL